MWQSDWFFPNPVTNEKVHDIGGLLWTKWEQPKLYHINIITILYGRILLYKTACILYLHLWVLTSVNIHAGSNTIVPDSGAPVDSQDVTKPQKENDEDIFGWFGKRPPSCPDTKNCPKMSANPSYGMIAPAETNPTDTQVTTGPNIAITPNPAYGGVQ